MPRFASRKCSRPKKRPTRECNVSSRGLSSWRLGTWNSLVRRSISSARTVAGRLGDPWGKPAALIFRCGLRCVKRGLAFQTQRGGQAGQSEPVLLQGHAGTELKVLEQPTERPCAIATSCLEVLSKVVHEGRSRAKRVPAALTPLPLQPIGLIEACLFRQAVSCPLPRADGSAFRPR